MADWSGQESVPALGRGCDPVVHLESAERRALGAPVADWSGQESVLAVAPLSADAFLRESEAAGRRWVPAIRCRGFRRLVQLA